VRGSGHKDLQGSGGRWLQKAIGDEKTLEKLLSTPTAKEKLLRDSLYSCGQCSCAQERWTSTPKHLFNSLSIREEEPSPPHECKSQVKLNTESVIMRVCDFAQLRLSKVGSVCRHFLIPSARKAKYKTHVPLGKKR